MAEMRQLERDASSAAPRAIRALLKARIKAGQTEGRDPSLYPWAGDRWRRMHWTMLVLDPCLMDKGKRFVRLSEGFAAKNEKGRHEASRDGKGRRIPAVQKSMPWAEWLWLTSTGGYPHPMRPYQKNLTPATCFYQVEPAAVAVPPPPPPPPMVCGCGAPVNETQQKFCNQCGKPVTVPVPPPPPPAPPPA